MMKRHLALFSVVLCVAVLEGCGCAGPPPDVQIEGLSASKGIVRLTDFKEKAVLLEFWATWCGPCKEVTPIIRKMQGKYGKDGLEVVAVTKEARATVEEFEKADPHGYGIYLDPDGKAFAAFKVEAIPQAFVIDKAGNLIWKGHPGEEKDLDDAIRRAVGK